MKRPNYAYPEVLAQRLPVPIYNAIVSDLSTDGAYLKTMAFANPAHDNLWFEPDMVGDAKASVADVASRFGGKYEDFSTLDLTEARGGGGGAADRGLGGGAGANPLRRLTLHRYRLNPLISLMARPALRRAVNGIGAIGLALLYEDPTASSVRSDGCTHHLGDTHHRDLHDSTTYTALDLRGSVDIAKLDVAYVPGTGYIAGVTFFDRVGRGEGGGVLTERLRWRQWEGKEPEGVVHVDNEPPERGDGAVWLFVGLAGTWVNTFGHGHLLARVSGVWRREGEEDG
ncbi:hypothetical protein BDV95DRAFT_190019 [Massariosphaeria phaeospora]|uniref:Uncharacterized protein n=1 Tax=Massariosphaeria phaeospora TaxID=100035 RepID=A0A7C8M2Q7_9PLEO|nr:hypothetical protein BDV95DRAFT_190019 [Massariosphaeria phaeospora]